MKTLANCKPSEFLSQTFKIKKSVEKWLDITKVLDIRNTAPEGIVKITEGMTAEEKGKALTANRAIIEKQARENLSRMLDAMLGEHPEETLELLALICFIEPEEIDNYETRDILGVIGEIMNDEAVISFFTSLIRSGQTVTQKQ